MSIVEVGPTNIKEELMEIETADVKKETAHLVFIVEQGSRQSMLLKEEPTHLVSTVELGLTNLKEEPVDYQCSDQHGAPRKEVKPDRDVHGEDYLPSLELKKPNMVSCDLNWERKHR